MAAGRKPDAPTKDIFAVNKEMEATSGRGYHIISIVTYCYDPKLISEPKIFYHQTISTLFNLMATCSSHR
jgi:hypothetical protein